MSLETVVTRRRYLHIAESLADTIRSEGMARGSRLPSERELATQFDVSPFEILEARRVFEGESAALAAERISNEELQKLKALLRQMEISYQEREPEDIERYDRRFHLAIAEASRNSAIVTTIDWLWTLRSRSEISRFFHKKFRDQGSK
ncbi:MAG: FCD domain-containing protein, partial [Exilibacterium sp.]